MFQNKPLIIFIFRVVIVQTFLLSVLTGLSQYLLNLGKVNVAKTSTFSVREHALNRNFRDVILGLDSLVGKDFERIRLKDSKGKIVFALPVNDTQESFLSITFQEQILLDGEGLYVIDFSYSVLENLVYVSIFWIISLIGFVPLGVMSFRQMERSLILSSELDLEREVLFSAKNLAHDIRSPLTALDMSIKSMEFNDPSQKQLVRSAINRIHDIANNLVGKTTSLREESKVESVLLTSTVSSIISEKRTEYRNLNHIDIDFIISNISYGLFSEVESSELKRIISNLINNSIEAIDKASGIVEIHLDSTKDFNQIVVMDNGKGITSDNVEKIFEDGVSIEKEDGTGIGLFHARQKIEQWGGRLTCKSEFGITTQFIISLPKSSPPKSFVKSIKLFSNSNIVVVDDDSSIHQVWKGRLESMNIDTSSVVFFSDPKKFLSWYYSNKGNPYVYLFDYEFLGHDINGLNLMDEVQGGNKYLVTSRYEEGYIKAKCHKDNIFLIDKGMIGFVPIKYEQNSSEKTVLIDDDDLIQMSWKMEADKKNINLATFSSVEEFLKEIDLFNADSKIYIDSNLADGLKGEVESEKIYQKGFKNLYIATGFSKDDFDKPEWIIDIVGKRAPF